MSMNSDGVGGSGERPFLFLVSSTNGRSMFVGTDCQSLKLVFHVALPAVAPLMTCERSKVSAAGISPCMMVTTSLCSTLMSLPRLALMTPVMAPMRSPGPFTSMPSIGSRSVGFAVSIAPSIALLVAGISCA